MVMMVDGGHSTGLPLHRVGPAAFQFGKSLTIKLGVAVLHWWEVNQHLSTVSLHHELQLPTRLFNESPRIAEGKILCHCTVNLEESEKQIQTAH